MKLNGITILFRRLFKNKVFVITNVLGLAVGISSALLLALIVSFELSFDNYHSDSNRIFRLISQDVRDGEISYDPGVPFPLRESFKNDFAEVEYFTMIDANSPGGLVTVEYNGAKVSYDEEGVVISFVHPDYFDIFDYSTKSGNVKSAISTPNTVVITERIAEKYFGQSTDVLNKVITLDNTVEVKIGAVIQNPPMNTDMPMQIFVSFETFEDERVWDSWTATSSSVNAFVKLKKNVDTMKFEEKIKNYIQKHLENDQAQVTNLLLQPLDDLHHNQFLPNYNWRMVSMNRIYVLSAIGVLLLLIAIINFVNLNTALSIRRSKEIGVRKVLGSSRVEIIWQYIKETGLITVISLILSLGIVELMLIKFNALIGFDLPPISYNLDYFSFLLVIFLVVTTASGLYPALFISRFKPSSVLKQNISHSSGKLSVRKVLIGFQLFVSQALVITVLVIYTQLDHFINEPMGIDPEAVVEFRIPDPQNVDMEAFRERLQNLSGVKYASFSNTGAASENSWSGRAIGTKDNKPIEQFVQIKLIDPHYMDTYGAKIIAGRNVVDTDTVKRFLLNEEAVRQMGYKKPEDALGARINIWDDQKGEIIGIIEDFHTMSLHHDQQPVAFFQGLEMSYKGAIKLEGTNVEATMKEVEQIWQSYFTEHIFSYDYLDASIESFYTQEKRLANIFGLFSLIAIIIGAIGLLGLISYMVNVKLKEIGIRKVLGASLYQILNVISSDFVKLSVVSFALAIPITWYFLDAWLQNFASRINLDFWIYSSALGLSLMITLLTVSFQSIKAALINPVDTLKDN